MPSTRISQSPPPCAGAVGGRLLSKMNELRRVVILVVLVPFAFAPRPVALLACRALSGVLMRPGSPYPGSLASTLPAALASNTARSRRAALRRMETLNLFDQALVLRAVLIPPWRRRVRLVGLEHLEQVLSEHKGAILWVHTCVSSNVAVKQALAEAGYPLVHLSRPSHGFSSSRFGVRIMSPIMRRSENRYLGERVVINAGNSVGPLRQLRRRLAENRVVSITVTRTAARLDSVPFLDGILRLPRGPVELATSTGAGLLPVFTSGDPAQPEVRIGAPLPVAGTRAGTVKDCEEAIARSLEEQVLRYPQCWTGWRHGLFHSE